MRGWACHRGRGLERSGEDEWGRGKWGGAPAWPFYSKKCFVHNYRRGRGGGAKRRNLSSGQTEPGPWEERMRPGRAAGRGCGGSKLVCPSDWGRKLQQDRLRFQAALTRCILFFSAPLFSAHQSQAARGSIRRAGSCWGGRGRMGSRLFPSLTPYWGGSHLEELQIGEVGSPRCGVRLGTPRSPCPERARFSTADSGGRRRGRSGPGAARPSAPQRGASAGTSARLSARQRPGAGWAGLEAAEPSPPGRQRAAGCSPRAPAGSVRKGG